MCNRLVEREVIEVGREGKNAKEANVGREWFLLWL